MNDFQVGDVVMFNEETKAARWAVGATTYPTIKGFSNQKDIHGNKMLIFENGTFPNLFGDNRVSPSWFVLVSRAEKFQKKTKNLPDWW
jgi:hypothetical protein